MTDGRTRKVVVFGSACVDLLMRPERLPRPGVTVLAPTYELLPGGKGANQAHACATASAKDDPEKDKGKVEFVGAVGADAFGDVLCRAFREAGVGVSGLSVHDTLPTACAAVIVDEDGENQIAVGSGANGAVVASRLRENGASFRLRAGDVLLQQMEIPAAEVVEAVDIAHEAGAFSVLNVAPSAPVPIETLRKLDFLIVNEHEAADVFRSLESSVAADDPVAQSRAIASMTGIAVIVTLGAEGAAACLPHRPAFSKTIVSAESRRLARDVVRVSAPDLAAGETIVDTTGAGDAFCGAFCASLAAGHSLSVCLRRASVAGTLGCTKVGARAGVPKSDAIERRASDVDVRADFGDDPDDAVVAALLAAPAAAWTRRAVA